VVGIDLRKFPVPSQADLDCQGELDKEECVKESLTA
jgi:hypothetical protein